MKKMIIIEINIKIYYSNNNNNNSLRYIKNNKKINDKKIFLRM